MRVKIVAGEMTLLAAMIKVDCLMRYRKIN